MRVLITGGAGFVGRHLTHALIEKGYGVRVLDALVPQVHPGSVPPADLHPAAELIVGDVRDEHCVEQALRGVDSVIHLAAEVGVGQSMYEIPRFVSANSLGTAVLLQAVLAHRSTIRKVVVASSMTLYGEGCGYCPEHGRVEPELRTLPQVERREWDTLCPHCDSPLQPAPTPETKLPAPTSVYAICKRSQEEYCLSVGRAYGIPTTALRYFNIYGVGQALQNPYTGVVSIFCNRILNGERVVVYEDGRQSRDFVHVQDIVQANVLALEAEEANYRVFNVSSGELWTVGEVAEMVQEHLGAHGLVDVTRQFRAGDIRHCHADLTQIRHRLGYRPSVGLRSGLPEVVRWARDQAQNASRDSRYSDLLRRAGRELVAHGLVI
jgi:dTDP-L-rhamnose 4-epimerase